MLYVQGCGHAYAALDESEQALSMYRTGGRMFTGNHLPLLFMGMEYLKTNNKNLARSFFNASLKLCNEDPLVYNEMVGHSISSLSHFLHPSLFFISLDLSLSLRFAFLTFMSL